MFFPILTTSSSIVKERPSCKNPCTTTAARRWFDSLCLSLYEPWHKNRSFLLPSLLLFPLSLCPYFPSSSLAPHSVSTSPERKTCHPSKRTSVVLENPSTHQMFQLTPRRKTFKNGKIKKTHNVTLLLLFVILFLFLKIKKTLFGRSFVRSSLFIV